MAIVHRAGKVQKFDGGVYCNDGAANENIVAAGSIPTMPLTACQHLAAAGCASWRTFDSFDNVDGDLMRYTKGWLIEGEPDFETVPADCRVTGNDIHALADAFKGEPQGAPEKTTASEPPEWEQMAVTRAVEIIANHKKKDLYPSQIDIADTIAKEFRAAGMVGAGGKPLTGAYIKRHALKGISSEQGRQLSTATRRGK